MTFCTKPNLASLKTQIDKLDIGKLVLVSVDFSKLSDAVKNDVVKKSVWNKLVAKISNIDISAFVWKTKYDADKSELEKKFPDQSSLVKNTDYSANISEIETKIPTDLVANSAWAAAEIKYMMLIVSLRKHITTQNLVNLKRNLLIITMTTNI